MPHKCKLLAVGDIMLHGAMQDKINETGDNLFPIRPIIDILKQGNIVFGNLETMITSNRTPHPGTPGKYFSPLNAASMLSEAGFNVVNIGHNHSYDWGKEGVETTIKKLEAANIKFGGLQGATNNLPTSVTLSCSCGKRFGFLFYCLTYNTLDKKNEYYAIEPTEERVKNDISSLTKEVDIIVASVHGGTCMNYWPAPDMLKTNRMISEAGAHIVLGHHAHVMNGIEERNGKIICHALPDFVRPFPFESDEVIKSMQNSYHESLLLEFNIDNDNSIQYTPQPLFFDSSLQTKVADNELSQNILKKLSELSNDIRENNSLQKYFTHAQHGFKEAYISNLWKTLKRGGVKWLIQRLRTLRPHHLRILLQGLFGNFIPTKKPASRCD